MTTLQATTATKCLGAALVSRARSSNCSSRRGSRMRSSRCQTRFSSSCSRSCLQHRSRTLRPQAGAAVAALSMLQRCRFLSTMCANGASRLSTRSALFSGCRSRCHRRSRWVVNALGSAPLAFETALRYPGASANSTVRRRDSGSADWETTTSKVCGGHLPLRCAPMRALAD